MTTKRVDDIFCKNCGGHNITVDYSECIDGDEVWETRTETWICRDCGKVMKVSTEWEMVNFCFEDEENGGWEEDEYDIGRSVE